MTQQDNPEERAHARLSASGAKRWMTCPGSVPVADRLPKRPSGGAAKLGTAAHSLGEHCLRNGFASPFDFVGQWVTLDGAMHPAEPEGEAFEVDDDMARAVQVYVSVAQAEHERLSEGSVVPVDLNIERRFDLTWLRPGMFGTNDCSVSLFMGELVVIDYKHGAGVFVPVEGNPQLRYYALGAAQEGGFMHETVRMIVVQPRCPSADGGVRSETLTMDELRAWAENELAPAADRVHQATGAVASLSDVREAVDLLDARGFLVPSAEGCKWCDLFSTCPAARRRVMEEAAADFDDEPAVLEAPSDLDLVAQSLTWVPFIDAWCRKVAEHAQRAVEAGERLPGYKLVAGRGSRKWRPDLTEVEIVRQMEALGVDVDDLYTEPKLVTGPAAEALIKGKGSGARKKEMAETLLLKVPGKPTLAPESDPREEVQATALSDFDDVED